MKKLLLLAVSLIVFATANIVKAQDINTNPEIIIGTGTNTISSLPVSINDKYTYTQQLYLASEMGGKSVIDKVYVQYASSHESIRTIDIYMGNTTKTTFSSGLDFVSLADMSLVFSGNVTFNKSAEWFEIQLDSPFVYDGTSSLVVTFDDNTNAYHSVGYFYYHNTSHYGSLYYRSSTDFNPASPTSSNRSKYRNNIKFSNLATEDYCFPPTISITDVQAKQITFTFTADDPEAELAFEYKRSTDTEYTTIENVTSSPFTLTGLTPSVKYELRAKTLCGNDSESIYVNKPFTTTSVNLPVIYVDADANGLRDGSSWTDAVDNLSSALTMAEQIIADHGTSPDIWVAAGTYYGDGISTNAFTMVEGVDVYGGFAGTETALGQRDIENNATILDGQEIQRVLCQNNDFTTSTVWDGFTIQRGGVTYGGAGVLLYANGVLRNSRVTNNHITTAGRYGAGVYNDGGTVDNCKVYGNSIITTSSQARGGGIYMTDGLIANCEVYGNEVKSGTSTSNPQGAGVCIVTTSSGSSSKLENTYIYDNYSYGYGGGLYAHSDSQNNRVNVVNCNIENNKADGNGGGVYLSRYANLINCNVNNNTSKQYGAGGYIGGYNEIYNCNFLNNLINNESTSYNGAGIYTISSDNFYNCIIWGNKKNGVSNQVALVSGVANIKHSAIEGGYTGAANIILSSDNTGSDSNLFYPKFTNPSAGAGAEYRGGNWTLQEGSDCIDKGTTEGLAVALPETDIDGNDRIFNNKIDLGPCESPYQGSSITPGTNNVIYVATEAAGNKDGSSWDNAISNLQYAVNFASSLDSKPQVWVKAGTYTATQGMSYVLTLAAGVEIYGGFAGTETELSQRDLSANKTILDGEGTRRVLYQAVHFTAATQTVVDGFTIQNAYFTGHGAGAYLMDYTVVRNCIFKNNNGTGFGSAMNCEGYVNVINCLIADNRNDNNNYCVWISNNSILLNTTVVNNKGRDILTSGNNVRIYNCIIWGNKDNSGNVCDHYYDWNIDIKNTAIEGSCKGSAIISLASENTGSNGCYPYFTDPENGDYTLGANSICVNRGSSSLVEMPSIDITGNERVKQGAVDLGAYESNHTPNNNIVPDANNIIYVAETSSGNGDGSSWANATSDLQMAVNLAVTYTPIAKIWVKAGTYYGYPNPTYAFIMREGVKVYGGFAGNEPYDYDLHQRDLVNNASILDGNNEHRVLYQDRNFTKNTWVEWDGFTIRNGKTNTGDGAAVFMREYCNIKNTTIINNYSGGSGAIRVYGNSSAFDTISNCIIQSNYSHYQGGGIICQYAHINNCLITNNTSRTDGGAVYTTANSEIYNSTIANNMSGNSYGAISNGGSYMSYVPAIKNCIIWGNKNVNGTNEQFNFSFTAGKVTYNAVEGGYEDLGNITLESANSGSGYYVEFTSPTAGAGNEYSGGDWTLKANSICINKGIDNIVIPAYDLAGNERIQKGVIDFGAYESSFDAAFDIKPDANNIIYVKINGTGDGSSWADATSDLNFALNRAASMSPKPTIWVAKGIYYGDQTKSSAFNIMPGVNVYGGFAGNEPHDYDLSQRDFITNATILDGNGTQRVLYQSTDFTEATAVIWDGFGIRNGMLTTDGGAGAYIRRYSTLINCEIYDNYVGYEYSPNSGSRNGGGVFLNGYNGSDGAPTIKNCIVRNNIAYNYGGGVYVYYGGNIINTKIIDNESTNESGGGISGRDSNIINCLISGNKSPKASGIYAEYGTNIVNTTVVKNISTSTSTIYGAIYNSSSGNTITNCIIWGNKCNEEYSQINGYSCTVSNTAIQGGYSGTANINIELDNSGELTGVNYINFIDAEHDVFELNENSVAVDAGNNSFADIPETDLNGKSRINNDVIDMGAYEQSCVKYRYVSKGMSMGQSVSFYGSTITEPGRYQKRWALDASCDSLVVMDVRMSGTICYVTETGAGLKDGSSWDNAYDDINVAVTNMFNTSGFDSKYVWVAAGTYKGNANNVAFPMLAGVEVFGGFAGNETSLAQRDIENNKTILTTNYNGQVIVAPSTTNPGTAELPAVWNGIHFNATIGKVQLAEHNTLENCIVSVGAEMNNATVKNCIFRDITNQSNRIIANASTLKGCKFYDNTFKYTYNSYGFITLNDATLDSCYVYSNVTSTFVINANNSNIVNSYIHNNTYEGYSSSIQGIVKATNNTVIDHTNITGNMLMVSNYHGSTKHYDDDEEWYDHLNFAVVNLESSTLKNSILWNNASSIFDNNFIVKDKASNVDYCAIDGAYYNGIGNILLSADNEGSVFSPYFKDPITDVGHIINKDTYDWTLNEGSICFGNDENGDAIGAVSSTHESTISINATDGIIYVSADGNGDGSSWSNATPYLQYALSRANTITPTPEVWVKAGVYYGNGEVGPSAFYVSKNVNVYGGFAGTETSVEDRDFENNNSILDGQNVQRVLFQSEPFADDEAVVWDGFVIRNGYMNQANFHSYNSVICKFSGLNNNRIAIRQLAGAGALVLSNTTLKNIVFDNNNIETGAPLSGSFNEWICGNALAMAYATADNITIKNTIAPDANQYTYANAYLFAANAIITNSKFNNNGGKVFIFNSTLDRCEIKDNQSLPVMPEKENYANTVFEPLASTVKNTIICNNKGVAVSKTVVNGIQYANTFVNTIISNNEGLAVQNHKLENGDKFINCNIVNNITRYNGATSTYAMISGGALHNTVVWNNRNYTGLNFDFDRTNLTKYSFNKCAIEFGIEGVDGIISLAPGNTGTNEMYAYTEFISPSGNDYDISSESGLIDAGDNSVVTEATDFLGRERIGDDIVDIGAVESGCVLKREYNETTTLSSYPFYGEWLTEPGTYTHRFENKKSDCDSVIVMHLSFKQLIYVKADASGLNNGTSWENAYTDLKMACDSVKGDGYKADIWVAKGQYKGDGTSVNAFILKPGVNLYGGFVGNELADYDITKRDIKNNETILDGGYIQRVICMQEDATEDNPVIIDGFTVKKGFSRQSVSNGTALYLRQHAIVRNCIITDNHTKSKVSVIHIDAADVNNCNIRKSINTFENCDIYDNQGEVEYAISSENTTFINCNIKGHQGNAVKLLSYTRFENCNISNNSGRAIWVIYTGERFVDEMGIEKFAQARHDLINCTIENNVGGVFVENPKPLSGFGEGNYYNTIFSNNRLSNKVFTIGGKDTDDVDGAAIRFVTGGTMKVYNCTFINNTANRSGGALYGVYDEVVNSVFYNNKADGRNESFSNYYFYFDEDLGMWYYKAAYSNLRYCALDADYVGEGNITFSTEHPLAFSGTTPTSKSACVNAGTTEGFDVPEYDVKGNSRVLHGRIDIGAIESNYTGTTFITPDANNVIYVKSDGTGDGSSWENATSQLQMAINHAATMEPQPEIWVKKGSYTYDNHNMWSMISVLPGTRLYGGFNGDENAASFDKNDRDFETNKTILDAQNKSRFLDQYCDFDDEERGVIDGFTIKNGNAEVVYAERIPASVFVFSQEYLGGGLRLKDNITVSNCDIYNNVSLKGGAIYAYNLNANNNVTIKSSKIYNNYAQNEGGGLYLLRGDGWNTKETRDSIVNCEISNNKSDRYGAMNIRWTKVIGSTIVSNNTEMYSFDTLSTDNRNNEYYNCVLWNNVSRNYANQIEGSENTYKYCAIQGGYTGEGNINLNKYNTGTEPGVNYVNFLNPEERAYRPMSNSVLVDAGNNEFVYGSRDLAGKERIANGNVDIGAYETGCISYRHMKVIANEQYVFYGDVLRESGNYSKQWTPEGMSCDSLVTLDLEVRKIWFVTETGAGTKDGSSWSNAMSDLQAAINQASSFKTTAKKQIWVAKGTYMGNGSSTQAFQLKPDVEIYGGFAGTEVNGIEFSERDLVTNETILSGSHSQRVLGNYNAYASFNAVENAVVDGFTIKDGYTTKEGGGVYIKNFVKIRNCIIKNNQGGEGAGIYADNKCEVTDCIISNNVALTLGGGVYCKSSTLTYCEVNNNLIDNVSSSIKCGGGIYGVNATINNTLIANNSVLTEKSYGGGMYIGSSALPSQLLNCTMVNNFSYYLGGGVYSVNSGSNNEFINCILWGNKTDLNTQQVAVSASNVPIYVRYSAIQGGAAGIGTINLTAENGNDMFSPRFVNPTEQVGANYSGGDWRIKEGSICINMGERLEYMIEQDLDDELRVKNGRIDIGAYETNHNNSFAIYPDANNIIYVKADNAGGDMTGSSWNNAINDLQLALNFAADNDDHPKVWIAKGTYTGNGWPYVDAFIGLNGIDIYGGFVGNEAHDYDLSQRDLKANATILDGQNIQRTLHQASDKHFKYSLDPMHYAIYDGLTIRNGFAHKNFGANVLMRKGELRNSIIEKGEAIEGGSTNFESSIGGAGIYSAGAANEVSVINSIIRNNKTVNACGGGYYGAITFRNCLINNNSSVLDDRYGGIPGGGTDLVGSVASTVGTCGAGSSAGNNSVSQHYNSTIVNNFADVSCGGINQYKTIVNSILWGNKEGGNIVSNLAVNGNGNTSAYNYPGISYSAIEGGYISDGVISLNAENNGDTDVNYPKFVNPTAAAGAGNYGDGDWRLQDGSVCVNRGTTTKVLDEIDLDGNPRIVNDSIDFGAYESNYEINQEIIPDANNIIYVTQTGAGTKDGSSWANATPYLQFAMDRAYQYEGRIKIWVAAGTYTGNGITSAPAFLMPSEVDLYGGFAGDEAADYDLSLRDFETNETVLDGQNLQQILRRDVYGNSARNIIDGFTFKNGRTEMPGGAISAISVNINNSKFVNNTCLNESSTGGGAAYLNSATVSNSQFLNNYSYCTAGAIFMQNTVDTIAYCLIKNNTALERGGGIYGNPNIINCEISNNTANVGGGINGSPNIYNSTIVNNRSNGDAGGGMYSTSSYGSKIKIYNTIIWGNKAGNVISNISGGYNIDFQYSACERDEFVPSPETNIILETDNTGDDITLNYVSFINPSEGEYQLMENSDCVDRGSNEKSKASSLDLAGNERIRGSIIDMGAYEQSPASCQMITDLQVPEDSLTFTTAYVTWTPGGTETEWMVYYDRVGENKPKIVTVEESHMTIENLSPNVEYFVKIRAKCSDDDYSSYSNQVFFTTVCDPDSVVWVNHFKTENLLPEMDQALQSNSTVLFSWDHIEGAESYELWLWRADDGHGYAIPDFPVAYNLDKNYHTVNLEKSVYQGYGQYPKLPLYSSKPLYLEQTLEEDIAYYAWKVVAYRECDAIETDTMYFDTALPDLHITAMDCSYAQTGQPMTVEWTVRNDGHGPTPVGEVWHDYIVLSYPIDWSAESFTEVPAESFIMEAVPNLTTLDVGESYTNSTTIFVPDDMYGAVFLFVLSNWKPGTELGLNFAQYGGVFPNPYTPNLYGEGKPYGFMTGHNSNCGNASFKEINGQDAFFYKAIEVDIPPIPDLIATNVIIPYEHFAGDTIAVSWQLINQGGAAFENIPVTDNIYMSTSDVFDSGVKMLGAFRDTISMGRGDTITRTVYLPTNERDIDTFYFFVETDTRNQVYESLFEDNNVSPASEHPVEFLAQPTADLEVRDLVISQDVLSPNETFTVSYTVNNIGYKNTDPVAAWKADTCGYLPAVNGKPWRDVIYISQDSVFTNAAKTLTSYNNNKILWTANELEGIVDTIDVYVNCKYPEIEAPETNDEEIWNQYLQEKESQNLKREALRKEKLELYQKSYSVEKSVKIPQEYLDGKYYIFVKTDSGDNIFEPDFEDNNVIRDSINVVLPDLYVDGLELNATRDTVSFRVTNIGDGMVIDGDITTTVNYNNSQIASFMENNINMNPNDEMLITVPIQLECNFFVDNTVKVETHLRSNEVTYTNNNQTIDVQLYNPDFAAHSLVIPSTQLASGQIFDITYSVTNNGVIDFSDYVNSKIYLGFSPELNFITAIELISKHEIITLAAGETKTFTETITMPVDADGLYYLYISVNDDEFICEGDNTYTNYIVSEMLEVALSPYPDLYVTQASIPDDVIAGTSIEISYNVTNQGTRSINDSEKWGDMIYISSEPNFNVDKSQMIGMVNMQGPLDVNGTYTQTLDVAIPANVTASQYIYIITDYYDNFYEFVGENNNVYRSHIVNVQSYDCDLTAAALNCEATYNWNQTADLEYTISNLGTSRTTKNYFTNAIYLSQDAKLDKNDILLKEFSIKEINGGKSETANAQVVIPYGMTGQLYFLLVADNKSSNPDVNQENNVLAKTVTIENIPVPDLSISNVTLLTEYPAAGQPIRIAYTVTNTGDGDIETSWIDKVFYSKNTFANGTVSQTLERDFTLAVGESYNDTTEVIIPLPNIGNYAIYIDINTTLKKDSKDRSLFEMDYEDNRGMVAVNVDYNPPGDLLVEDIICPYVVTSGDDMEITYRVKNLGPNVLDGVGCNDVFYLSKDETFGPDDVLLGNYEHELYLPNYAYEEYTFTANISGVPEGEYYVIIYTDARNAFHEVNEENNRGCSAYPFEVKVTELFLDTPITFKLKDLAHKDFKFNVYGNINETVLIHLTSPDSQDGAVNNIYVKYNNMGSNMDYTYSSDGDMKGDAEVYIPTTRAGYYGISVMGNDPIDGEQMVTIEANILPFEIRSVDANVAGNTGKVTVRLLGSKFRYDMPVKLFMGDKNAMTNVIEAEEVHYVNFNEVYVTFDLTGAEEGLYSIEAYNYCAGYTYLVGCFTITGGLPENFATNLIIPSGLRQNRYCILTLEYGNIGNTDIVDPKIKLCSIGGSYIGLERGELNIERTELDIPVEGVKASDGRTILRPGERYTVSIYCFTNQSLEFVIYSNEEVRLYEQLKDEIIK